MKTNFNQVYEWAKTNFSNIGVVFVSLEHIEAEATKLNERFELATHIPGMQQLHARISLGSTTHLHVKKYSLSSELLLVKISKSYFFYANLLLLRQEANLYFLRLRPIRMES